MYGYGRFGGLVRVFAPLPEVYPAGTRLVFDQSSPPTGWTRDVSATLDDRLLRIVVGARAPNGGSWTISGLSGDSHQHGLSKVVAHSHSGSIGSHAHTIESYSYIAGTQRPLSYTLASQYNLNTSSQGISITLSESGAASPMTALASYAISSDGSWRPLFRGAIIAQKD